jgi:hypothetical protein
MIELLKTINIGTTLYYLNESYEIKECEVISIDELYMKNGETVCSEITNLGRENNVYLKSGFKYFENLEDTESFLKNFTLSTRLFNIRYKDTGEILNHSVVIYEDFDPHNDVFLTEHQANEARKKRENYV